MDYEIPLNHDGLRLDAAVAEATGGTRNQAKTAVLAGRVRLDGRRAAKGDRVRAGQVLTVTPLAAALLPDDTVPVSVIAEAADWLVLDKPAGVPVLPKDGSPRSLITGLMAHRPADAPWAQLAEEDRAAVHRLDTETSGCLLFAKTEEAHAQLRANWGGFTKRYTAQVGPGFSQTGRLEAWLAVTKHRPARVEAVPADRPGARRCALTVLKATATQDGQGTRLNIELETGFLHQIRVMLASLGCPVNGDAVYGDPSTAPRLMLHAHKLSSEAMGIQAQCKVPF